MRSRTESESLPITISAHDGTLGRFITISGVDKFELFKVIAFRMLILAVLYFIKLREGRPLEPVFILLFIVFMMSPLRFMGRKIEFYEYGIRYQNKDYFFLEEFEATWSKSTYIGTSLHLDIEIANLNVTYIKDIKKVFLEAYS